MQGSSRCLSLLREVAGKHYKKTKSSMKVKPLIILKIIERKIPARND